MHEKPLAHRLPYHQVHALPSQPKSPESDLYPLRLYKETGSSEMR